MSSRSTSTIPTPAGNIARVAVLVVIAIVAATAAANLAGAGAGPIEQAVGSVGQRSHDIALADDAGDLPVVDDHCGTDPVLSERFHELADGRVRGDRHHVRSLALEQLLDTHVPR